MIPKVRAKIFTSPNPHLPRWQVIIRYAGSNMFSTQNFYTWENALRYARRMIIACDIMDDWAESI